MMSDSEDDLKSLGPDFRSDPNPVLARHSDLMTDFLKVLRNKRVEVKQSLI